ncbi:MAG: 30S ribosomal protein S8 [Candidatus Micrarchaeota archaeon]
MVDTIANSLNVLKLADKKGKKEVVLKQASKLLAGILEIMKENNFIESYEKESNTISGEYKVSLLGRINSCGPIKPRFPVRKNEWEKYETRFLPAREIGLLIVATPKGLLSHKQAKEKETGGKLICFVY